MQIDAACQAQIFGVYAATPVSLVPFSVRKFFFSKGLSPDFLSSPIILFALLLLLSFRLGSLLVMGIKSIHKRRRRDVELDGEERQLRAAQSGEEEFANVRFNKAEELA